MKDLLKRIKLNEGNISTIMGVAVMLLTGILMVQYFKSVNKTPKIEKTLSTSTDQAAAAPTPTPEVKAGSTYTIQAGDSLWTISVKTYGDGYAWSKVYQLNKEVLGNNPNLLAAGTKISLPQIDTAKASQYTVARGDNLWNIAVAKCGSGYAWTQIAAENQLTRPGLIHVGNVLKISCTKK